MLESPFAAIGYGGRKSGMCDGGSQLDNRGRFLEGEEGFDMGEGGNVSDVNNPSAFSESGRRVMSPLTFTLAY